MAIVLKYSESEECTIDNLTYAPEQGAFIANEKSQKEIEFPYPLDRDRKYNIAIENFSCFIFYRDEFAANNIFEVHCNNERLGWLFPVQALLTNQHDFAESEHFLPYAEAAFQRLIFNHDNLPYRKIYFKNKISLEEIYGENTFIFIVYNKYIDAYESKHGNFDISNYLVYFYSYGYTILNYENFESLYNNSQLTEFTNFSSNIIQIKPISASFLRQDKNYINSLYQGILKNERHPLVKFQLLYSLIELFISKIFESEFQSNLHIFRNPLDFYDAKEKLTKLTNEKSRLNKLFETQCPGLSREYLQELKDSSNIFLNTIDPNKTYNKSASEGIYKVRSALFHNLRNMPPNYFNQLDELIKKLEKVIFEIILKIRLI